MAKISLFLSVSLFVNLGMAGELRGVRPLPSRTAYSVTCFTETIGVGANLLSPDQVRRLFGGEIDRSYIVVEVGFYSKTHTPFDVRHADFALRNRPSRTLVKPVDPNTITATVSRPADKTLPEVSTSQAVAGYLFFPITEAGASFYELDYTGNGAWLTLPLKP